MLSDSERLYILIVQYGLARDAEYEDKIKRLISKRKLVIINSSSACAWAVFFMLLCARIRGQGARVRLGWCARLISSVPLLLPRRKRSYARFALPAHLISPADRRLF